MTATSILTEFGSAGTLRGLGRRARQAGHFRTGLRVCGSANGATGFTPVRPSLRRWGQHDRALPIVVLAVAMGVIGAHAVLDLSFSSELGQRAAASAA
jgi:hypothetical protein